MTEKIAEPKVNVVRKWYRRVHRYEKFGLVIFGFSIVGLFASLALMDYYKSSLDRWSTLLIPAITIFWFVVLVGEFAKEGWLRYKIRRTLIEPYPEYYHARHLPSDISDSKRESYNQIMDWYRRQNTRSTRL